MTDSKPTDPQAILDDVKLVMSCEHDWQRGEDTPRWLREGEGYEHCPKCGWARIDLKAFDPAGGTE